MNIARSFYKGFRLKAALVFLTASLAFAGAPPAALESTDPATTQILDRYVASTQAQSSSLRGMKMDVEIDAALPKLKKTGKMQALRSISKLGQITYQGLKFIGDNTIKNDVIVRYLTAERQTQDMSSLAITPKNYKFKYKGLMERDGREVYVFQVSPRKKMVGLFKGELWVDSDTYLPVREAGRFVKNPSIFLKRVDFVREYQIKDGMAIPRHIESTVRTRFWGPAQMSIDFKNYSRAEEEQAATVAPTRDTQ
jgi:hypothetical protein